MKKKIRQQRSIANTNPNQIPLFNANEFYIFQVILSFKNNNLGKKTTINTNQKQNPFFHANQIDFFQPTFSPRNNK